MPLLDRRKLIFEWAPGQRFGPPTNIENDVHFYVDGIKNENDIFLVIKLGAFFGITTPKD